MIRRVGILLSHPIQYFSPWLRVLSTKLDLQVFYAHHQSAAQQSLAGFGVPFEWDTDLLSGYDYRFLANVSRSPGTDHFFGCDTPEVAQVIRDQQFDAFIVCGWQLKSYWQATRACRSKGVPILVRGDSQLGTPRSRLKTAAKALCYPWLLRRLDGFLVVGKRNREYLRHYGVPEKNLFITPHFVDNDWFFHAAQGCTGQRGKLRSSRGVCDGTLMALFVGKLQPVKRPLDILHALAILKRRGTSSVGVFVGSGELETRLRDEAARLGVCVRFEGFKNQSQLPLYYCMADVLVLPSESETWGLVVNEGMACGLPAIVSKAVGCGPDLIQEGVTGFTFPTGNALELAVKLESLQSRRTSGYSFSRAVKERISHYCVESAVAGTIRAVETVAERRRTEKKRNN